MFRVSLNHKSRSCVSLLLLADKFKESQVWFRRYLGQDSVWQMKPKSDSMADGSQQYYINTLAVIMELYTSARNRQDQSCDIHHRVPCTWLTHKMVEVVAMVILSSRAIFFIPVNVRSPALQQYLKRDIPGGANVRFRNILWMKSFQPSSHQPTHWR